MHRFFIAILLCTVYISSAMESDCNQNSDLLSSESKISQFETITLRSNEGKRIRVKKSRIRHSTTLMNSLQECPEEAIYIDCNTNHLRQVIKALQACDHKNPTEKIKKLLIKWQTESPHNFTDITKICSEQLEIPFAAIINKALIQDFFKADSFEKYARETLQKPKPDKKIISLVYVHDPDAWKNDTTGIHLLYCDRDEKYLLFDAYINSDRCFVIYDLQARKTKTFFKVENYKIDFSELKSEDDDYYLENKNGALILYSEGQSIARFTRFTTGKIYSTNNLEILNQRTVNDTIKSQQSKSLNGWSSQGAQNILQLDRNTNKLKLVTPNGSKSIGKSILTVTFSHDRTFIITGHGTDDFGLKKYRELTIYDRNGNILVKTNSLHPWLNVLHITPESNYIIGEEIANFHNEYARYQHSIYIWDLTKYVKAIKAMQYEKSINNYIEHLPFLPLFLLEQICSGKDSTENSILEDNQPIFDTFINGIQRLCNKDTAEIVKMMLEARIEK